MHFSIFPQSYLSHVSNLKNLFQIFPPLGNVELHKNRQVLFKFNLLIQMSTIFSNSDCEDLSEVWLVSISDIGIMGKHHLFRTSSQKKRRLLVNGTLFWNCHKNALFFEQKFGQIGSHESP